MKPSALCGTVIITGANGSLGVEFVRNLLQKYPSHFTILTVRDDSINDQNTLKLRQVISNFNGARCSVEAVDLGSLSAVRTFAESVMERVKTKKLPPIYALVCNAFKWDLIGQQISSDGYELGFQVTHLSHFMLVLKLLGSMDRDCGRIVFLGSEAHDGTATNSLRPLGAVIPDNLQDLVAPLPNKPGEGQSRGFQRYGTAKLVSIMFMYKLNRKLLKDSSLSRITALSTDPGGIPGSGAFKNVPPFFKILMLFVATFVAPIAKYFTKTLTTPTDAGRILVTMSLDPDQKESRGYFLQNMPLESSAASHDENMQDKLWVACEKWASLDPTETVLR